MNRSTLPTGILFTFLCAIVLGDCFGMEMENKVDLTDLLQSTHLSANWNFTDVEDKPVLFTFDGKKEVIRALQIKNESLQFSQDCDVLYVAIPCTEKCTLIMRQSKNLLPPSEGDIKKLINSETRRVRLFSAPMISISPEAQSFKFDMNHKGNDGIDAMIMTPLYQATKSITLVYEETKGEFIVQQKPPTLKINSPFTFVYLNSENQALLQGQVVNPIGMLDALCKPIKKIEKDNSPDACECVTF